MWSSELSPEASAPTVTNPITLTSFIMGYIAKIREKVGHDPVFMPAAACLILNDNKLLLQLRADNKKWGIHGGCMEFGETPEQTLLREVQEELNITPTSYKIIGVYAGAENHVFYPNGDEVYVVVTLFLVDGYEGEIKPDQDEVLAVKWLSVDETVNKDEINPPDYHILLDTIKFVKKNISSR